MGSSRWTRDQLKLAFHLYCRLPFGQLHSRHPEIVELAGLIGRLPGALAMKLVNLASLNPANGLCLSALHDRAFDQRLIALSNEFTFILSEPLRRRAEPFVSEVLWPLAGRQIELPERFMPSVKFLAWHRREVFVD